MQTRLNSPSRALLVVALSSLVALSSGCVSARYQAADADTPPPVRLDFTASQPPLEATVHSVITCQGPGSWKRDAYWDEYVVSLTNRGEQPVQLESASLTDFRGDASEPGVEPWSLEKQSLTRGEELSRLAKAALVQVGTGYGVVGVAGGLMFSGGVACASAGALMFGGVIPVYAVGAYARNRSHRHDIEEEFARRRLALPATIAPGQTVQGSLFFRISPGPQRLELRGSAGAQPATIALTLAALSNLHLNGTRLPTRLASNPSNPPAP